MSNCLRCGRCCTSFGVCVTPFDIARISKATGLPPVDFIFYMREPPQRQRKEPAVILHGRRFLIVLKWKAPRLWVLDATVCSFYGPEGCSIYESRPMLCRTYPFLLKDGRLEDVCSRACETRWRPEDEKQYRSDLKLYEKEVEEYAKIADCWNRKGGGSPDAFLKFSLESISAAACRTSGRSKGI